MRFAWSTAAKDWLRHRRDPIGIILWVGIPLVVGAMITLASGGSDGAKPTAHVLVADQDETFLSGLLINALGQAGGLVQAEKVDLESGEARISKGEATALLIIPPKFAEDVLNERSTQLSLVTNPAQRILPGIVEEGLSVLVDGTFYLHRLIGEDLREFAAGPPGGANTFPDTQITEFSVEINQLVNRLSGYLFPLVIQVEMLAAEDGEGTEPNLALLFLPGLLVMALLFMGQGLSIDLWRERDQKTLRRVVVSPQMVTTFLVGKVAASIGLIALVCGIALAVGYAYFDLDVRTLPLAVVWASLTGAMLLAIMMVIQVFSSSQRAGSVMTMVLVFPLMMAGGSFFPFEAMPEWMARFGRLTPNGWALEQLKSILFGRIAWGSLGVAFVALSVVCVVLFMVCARRLRSGFAEG